MKIRDDRGAEALVRWDDEPWSPSPEPGVERRMLERDGEEDARATTVVRFAVGSAFASHVHPEGEEFLVLEGEFVDEYGRFGVGSYVRNPPGSEHRPSAPQGCIILVKLRQFAPDDAQQVVVDAECGPWRTIAAGHERMHLHAHGRERVWVDRFAAGYRGTPWPQSGAEVFVVRGRITASDRALERWTWWRRPTSPGPVHAETETVVWVKAGHLPP
jgi:quercetin dioxygenase-like cupin family protein